MITNTFPPTEVTATHRRKLRLLAVAGSALATVVVWLVANKVFGIDLYQPAFDARAPQPMPAGFVAVVGAMVALFGWGLLALFERFSLRGERLWLFVAITALLLSLGAPFSGHGISDGNRIALVCMHLAAAAIVIPLFHRSSNAATRS
ncbi:MAG: DUF6069 family protein [Betaproteobacteria bacterium]